MELQQPPVGGWGVRTPGWHLPESGGTAPKDRIHSVGWVSKWVELYLHCFYLCTGLGVWQMLFWWGAKKSPIFVSSSQPSVGYCVCTLFQFRSAWKWLRSHMNITMDCTLVLRRSFWISSKLTLADILSAAGSLKAPILMKTDHMASLSMAILIMLVFSDILRINYSVTNETFISIRKVKGKSLV